MTDKKEDEVLSYQEKCRRLLVYASRFGAIYVPLEPEEEVDRELARYEAWARNDPLFGTDAPDASKPD